ncbi:MAG: NAD-dependent epimerase/dehydratase family protein [Deltaproteobacteria bacterium]|nr:NAD-dependent epimerase/dehydratase family protein [Deltaproteobacteria bacterium]
MYLITGGAGFIGSHIGEKLVAMGERVRVLDNFSSGKRANLAGLEDKIEVIAGDILDLDAFKRAAKGASVIFHQAALRSVPFSVENPTLVNRVNVEGTLNVLTAARDAGVKRVVYASSSSAYGRGSMQPKKETDTPGPISPYAVSKLAGEYYCKVFSELYGLETVSLRYFNVFGPRQDANSQYAAVIPRFIQWGLGGSPLEVHGDGLQSRDFTYIDNVVAANLQAAQTQVGIGGTFNVGQGETHTLLDSIAVIEKNLQIKLKRSHMAARAGDVRFTQADISESKRCLGYNPEVSFEEGLAKTVKFFRTGMA